MLAQPDSALLLDSATLRLPGQSPCTWTASACRCCSSTPTSATTLPTAPTPTAGRPASARPPHSGVTHLAEIPLSEIARIDALPEPEARRARHVITEQARVADAVQAFADADAPALGRAFAGSHTSLSRDYEVSCPELDVAVSAAVVGGAAAARMTGGGFGGNVVTLCRPEAVARVQDSVRRR